MARTKNRGYQQTLTPTYTAPLWKMGGYIRLSREDLQKINRGIDDSSSVKNQRDILNDFHHNHIDEFESYTEYVDDGHTGTDTERESLQRLLGDVMSGKINCVVGKDLSRFARNYSDARSLIDNLFVQMGVRFISLAESVDSYLSPDSVNSIIVPITNVMNDQYCYQTSKKIRQIFDYKRRNGQYIGSFAPYGYIKDPKDKHQLIVDPEAAEIVKKIYEMCLQGTAKLQIVMYLNDHGIPSPTAYRKLKGLPYSPAISDAPMWGNKIITDILRNPIYTGDLVQGRRRVKSYKVHQIDAVPGNEWVRVPDTHEAIITHETFERVQELLKRDTRTACTMHSIKHNRLDAAGLSDVLARLTAKRKELSNGVAHQHPALLAFAKYQNIEKLTREILIELVDHIKVYENGNISVHFKFADEFRRITEYIEINTTDPAKA